MEQAVAGKDYALATEAIRQRGAGRMADVILAQIAAAAASLPTLTDKTVVSESAERMKWFLRRLPAIRHPAADALILDLFGRRNELAKVKGQARIWQGVTETLIERLAAGPKPLQAALAAAHAEFDAYGVAWACKAAQQAWTPAKVYDQFAPYVLAGAGKKGAAPEGRTAVLEEIGAEVLEYSGYKALDVAKPSLDPRWHDLGIKFDHLGIIHAAGPPCPPAARKYLTERFAAVVAGVLKRKRLGDGSSSQLRNVVATMGRVQHPDLADLFTAAFREHFLDDKRRELRVWFCDALPYFPKTALPALEAFGATLEGDAAADWAEGLGELRTRT